MNKTNHHSLILRSSSIKGAGIGVFALHDIDANTWLSLKPRGEFVGVDVKRELIPEELLIYCIDQGNGVYHCPSEFNHMHIVWYLNHSDTPNTDLREDGYYSNRVIKAGEEILINYKIFHEPGYVLSPNLLTVSSVK